MTACGLPKFGAERQIPIFNRFEKPFYNGSLGQAEDSPA